MRVTSKPSSPGTAPVTGVGKPAASSPVNAPSAVQGPEAVGDALSVSSTAQFIAVAEAHLAQGARYPGGQGGRAEGPAGIRPVPPRRRGRGQGHREGIHAAQRALMG